MSNDNKPSILIVDDEPLILDVVQEMLSIEGFNIILANSAEEALELLDGGVKPNLIISDINMPGMNGFDFFEEVQKRPQLNVLPFIFLSALYDQPIVAHGKELGVDDYLMKPFTREELLATIKGKLRKAEKINASYGEQISSIKGKILQMLSHEFRTPLTTIIGFASVLSDESTHLSEEELKRFMELIKKGGDRLNSLVEDFLESSSIEAGEMQKLYDSTKQVFEINIPLRDSIKSFSEEIEHKKLELVFETPDNLPLVFGSSSQIIDIFKRIVSNAIKFSNDNSKIIISISTDPDYLIINVKDFGMGIPEEEIPKIYDKFYQVKREKYEQQGSGLGLFIAKKLAQINNCILECKSSVNEYTVFTLKIPLAKNI
ncbi:MAG TPA: response regulator [Ignavibacteria bacterium]|jgi:signal transduction histidine kinase